MAVYLLVLVISGNKKTRRQATTARANIPVAMAVTATAAPGLAWRNAEGCIGMEGGLNIFMLRRSVEKSTYRPIGLLQSGANFAFMSVSCGYGLKYIGPHECRGDAKSVFQGGRLIRAKPTHTILNVTDHALGNIEFVSQFGAGQTTLLTGFLEAASYYLELLGIERILHNATQRITQSNPNATPCSLFFVGGR